MPKITVEHSDKRRNEIINACRELYKTKNFKEITIKDISVYTSFSRPSIYNYFTTKESIFLEIFREEYAFWIDDLNKIKNEFKILNVDKFAQKFAKTIENRPYLLKLLSMNLYDLEENCEIDSLVNFKLEFGKSLTIVAELLKYYFPKMSDKDIENFIYEFFPFMYGIYPYTSLTEKQKEAIKKAQIKFEHISVYELVYKMTVKLLESNNLTKELKND